MERVAVYRALGARYSKHSGYLISSRQQPLRGERLDKVTRLDMLQSGFRPTSVWLQNLFYSMDSAFSTKSQEVSKDRGGPQN